jgi:hypothetical protein
MDVKVRFMLLLRGDEISDIGQLASHFQVFHLSEPLYLHFSDYLRLQFRHPPTLANRPSRFIRGSRLAGDLKQFRHVINGMQLSKENLFASARLAERTIT